MPHCPPHLRCVAALPCEMQKNEITAETYVGVVEVERRDGAVATSKHHQCCRLDAVVPLQIQRR